MSERPPQDPDDDAERSEEQEIAADEHEPADADEAAELAEGHS